MKDWEQDDTFLSKWLNNELSQADKEAFETSEDGIEFLKIVAAAENLEAPDYDAQGALDELKGRISNPGHPQSKTIFMRPVFKIAAAATFLLALTIAYLLRDTGTTISTGLSEQEIVTLPDGSQVKLNANSDLTYNEKQWSKKRQIELKGEAFFDVTPGSTFSIVTETGTTAVLGTSFNVKSRHKTLDVFCFTGKVNVTVSRESIDLTPGMAVRFEKGDLVRSDTRKLKDGPSWMNGITKLDDVPLPVALEELRHIFGITIEYDGSLDELIYNGAFPHENPESAFKLVLDNLNIDYSYDSNTKKLKVIGLNP